LSNPFDNLYRLSVRSVRLLFEGEDTCLAAEGSCILRKAFQDPTATAERREVGEIVEKWVDEFVTTRYLLGQQDTPIIDNDSPNLTLHLMENAGELNPAIREKLHRALSESFYAFAMGIMFVGGGNGYTGLAIVAEAIAEVAVEQQVDPLEILDVENAIAATEFRSEVFRRCMTPEQWQAFSDYRVGMLESDDSATELIGNNPAELGARAHMAGLAREYFETRYNQIWPDNG
jgi:hypothetical protein